MYGCVTVKANKRKRNKRLMSLIQLISDDKSLSREVLSRSSQAVSLRGILNSFPVSSRDRWDEAVNRCVEVAPAVPNLIDPPANEP